ncbi:hypothetical protein HHI36_013515 [Cryptolaemus montrouzieri]|uniref:Secreted protein n=1 Tax=Cryptolaemus montrouzieri TaxID=559131 RepID=A0ABD2NI27_9CUCU
MLLLLLAWCLLIRKDLYFLIIIVCITFTGIEVIQNSCIGRRKNSSLYIEISCETTVVPAPNLGRWLDRPSN